jgi:hypothetical protein
MRERTQWLILGETPLAAKCDGGHSSGGLFQSIHRGDVFHFSFAVFSAVIKRALLSSPVLVRHWIP